MSWWLASLLACAALGAAPESAANDAAEAREAMRRTTSEVLARAEFVDSATPKPAWWRSMVESIIDLLEGAASAVRSLPVWLFWILVAWMLLALLAALAHMLWGLYQLVAPGGPGHASGQRERRAGEILGIRDLDYASVLAQGRALLEQGRFGDAVRYFYVAAILELEHQGAVLLTPAKTNRDYLRELQAAPRLQAPFAALTRRYELSTYGGLSTDRGQCDEMLALLTGLRG